MFSENLSTIEEILKNYFDESELRVKEINCEPGSKDGDNYMSLIKRINISYYRPDDKGIIIIVSATRLFEVTSCALRVIRKQVTL